MNTLARIDRAVLLLVAALAGACSHAPKTEAAAAPPASLDCTALWAEAASADERRQGAENERQAAWKAIVPFVVAARFANAQAAAGAAGERADALRGEAARRGCATTTTTTTTGGGS